MTSEEMTAEPSFEAVRSPTVSFVEFDSSRGSPVMLLLLPGGLQKIGFRRYTSLWISLAVLAYVPSIVSTVLSGHRLIGKEGNLILPYLHDMNLMIMLLISLPALFLIYLRDAELLPEVSS